MLIVSDYDHARLACPGARFEYYLPWKDCYPTSIAILAEQTGKTKPSQQQVLIEGVLHPKRLLDVLQNFVIFMQVDGRTVKIAPRYQQYRAVLKAMQRLEQGKTRQQDGEFDRRGGVIFHTQGSGKSLTMVFLVRRMRTRTRKHRIDTIKALVKSQNFTHPQWLIIDSEFSEVLKVERTPVVSRRHLLQILHSTRALDSCLAEFATSYGCSIVNSRQRSLGGYLRALSGSHLRNSLPGLSVSYYQANVVNKRNRYMHEAGAFPGGDAEVNTILAEMEACIAEVSAL